MTERDKVIALAQEAGFTFVGIAEHINAIERFAALLSSQAEQEPIATLIVHNGLGECRVQCERLCPEVPIGMHSLHVVPPPAPGFNEAIAMAAKKWEAAHGFDKHGVAAFIRALGCPSQAPSTYACNACEWKGPFDETLMLGSVGPLCPDCHETTESVTATSKPVDSAADDPIAARIVVNQCQYCHHFDGHAADCGVLGTEVEVPAQITAREPVEEWAEYARRSGLLDENGVAIDRHKTQTAWFAYTAAWNTSLSRAQTKAEAPEGWKLVPVELTDEMSEAFAAAEYTFSYVGEDHPGMKYQRKHQYRAMIAAAPQQKEGGE